MLMEAFFVLTKLYNIPKNEAIQDLKAILSFKGVVNENKIILMETLNILEYENIGFADALIRAKIKLQDYTKLSLSSIRIDLTKI